MAFMDELRPGRPLGAYNLAAVKCWSPCSRASAETQLVSHCFLDFAVGRHELQKGLWQQQMGQGLLEL